jgi:hypothetical protein
MIKPAQGPPAKAPRPPAPTKDGQRPTHFRWGKPRGHPSPQPQGSPEVSPTPPSLPLPGPARAAALPADQGNEEHDARTDRQPPHRQHQGHRNSRQRPPTLTPRRQIPMAPPGRSLLRPPSNRSQRQSPETPPALPTAAASLVRALEDVKESSRKIDEVSRIRLFYHR